MNDKVNDLIEKVKDTAMSAGEVIGKYAGTAKEKATDLLILAKIKAKILDLENEISKNFKIIGKLLYDLHLNKDIDSSVLFAKFTEVDELSAKIYDLKAKTDEVKKSGKIDFDASDIETAKESSDEKTKEFFDSIKDDTKEENELN